MRDAAENGKSHQIGNHRKEYVGLQLMIVLIVLWCTLA
jgi:hypothetical protein